MIDDAYLIRLEALKLAASIVSGQNPYEVAIVANIFYKFLTGDCRVSFNDGVSTVTLVDSDGESK